MLQYVEERQQLADVSHPFHVAIEDARSHVNRGSRSRFLEQQGGWRMALWSPSFYPTLPSCVMLVLTLDGEALLYALERDTLTTTLRMFFSFRYHFASLAEPAFTALEDYSVTSA